MGEKLCHPEFISESPKIRQMTKRVRHDKKKIILPPNPDISPGT